MPSARLIGVGVFVLGGLLLFAVGLFMIGERRLLFADNFEVSAEFAKVSGLEPGGKVRVGGLDAGEVLTINVPTHPTGTFRVKMRVREDLHPVVRTDSVASIQNDGLVGNKFVQVEAGTERAPRVPEGGTIRSREPVEIGDVLQQMSDTIGTINTTIVELRGNIDQAIDQIAETVQDAEQLIEDVGVDVQKISAAGTRIASDTREIIDGIRAGRGTLGKLVNDDEFYQRAVTIADEAERTARNLRETSEQAKEALAGLRSKNGPVDGIANELRQTLTSAREVISDMADNAEALKRNWFFRGFFNRRGYFDLDDVGPAQYRAGTLETKDRSVLRIWLDAAVLFTSTDAGDESVSEGGKARLDSAMTQFIRYPANTPLVVEGYAARGPRDEQYLRSRARAAAVRTYVVGKFHLDASRVGLMPLGADVVGSPKGQSWEGVALAMFVERRSTHRESRPTAAGPAR